ncbi:MAG: Hsp20/alpha crystallin family protein [Deltaproteobacteria bacterium]|nr:Hsp20/alpha crystallin family protein [Deltaproteobacteria bacterium]
MSLPSVLDEIDRLFDELVHRRWGPAGRQVVPAGIREVEDGWIIELPVEGLRAEDLKVEVHGRRLTVSGHRRRERSHREPWAGWMRTHQEVALRRIIALPAEAKPEDVEAKLEGATLTIHVRRHKK